MSKLIETGAVQIDADICNNIDPPLRGCHAGPGTHLAIPNDWLARILAGQQVPGCNYHALSGGALFVSDFAVAQIAIPAVVAALSPTLRGAVGAFQAKLAAATKAG